MLLTGARQTGKTTLCRSAYPALRYVNLDAPENRDALSAISSHAWWRDVGPAVIDEAQKLPVVFEKVKFAFDEQAISFSVLTGSSQILLLRKIRETLAGRVFLYELFPLMACELFAGLQGGHPASPLLDRLLGNEPWDRLFGSLPGTLLAEEESARREVEEHLLFWGGMPALLHLSPAERGKWLRDYEQTYLERDLSDLARLDDLGPFRRFQRLAALRSGKLLQYAELARDVGISVDTARRYLEYLRISYQGILLPPYHRNLTSAVIKTPKFYWGDVGLLRRLSGYRGESTGEIYETYVVAEIVKWMRTVQRPEPVFFYRTRSGLEVDLLIETEEGMIGIEIKARERLARADTRSLTSVAEALGRSWRGGLLVYRGSEISRVGEPALWAVPSRRLFTG